MILFEQTSFVRTKCFVCLGGVISRYTTDGNRADKIASISTRYTLRAPCTVHVLCGFFFFYINEVCRKRFNVFTLCLYGRTLFSSMIYSTCSRIHVHVSSGRVYESKDAPSSSWASGRYVFAKTEFSRINIIILSLLILRFAGGTPARV